VVAVSLVGAVIFHARDWFSEISRAFANQDLNNPDVRFFLEKKLESVASGDSKTQEAFSPLVPSK
jgi:hypothetical protein